MVLSLIKTSNDARQIYRANALNLRSKGLTVAEVADYLEITPRTVYNIENNYEKGGLNKAINDNPRPGAPKKLDDRFKSHVVAIVCSQPPEGFDRWTLELIRSRVLEQKYIDKVSDESIRLILKEHDLKPWQQASWCVPNIDSEYIARMENLLDLYEKPYEKTRPMLCLDEKTIQLLDHVRSPRGISPGKCHKVDYEYKRKGTCNAFCLVEPKIGVYDIKVTKHRKREDFADYISEIAQRYANAEKIDLVLDNLNTHSVKSLINRFGHEKGQRIWDRFVVHYTPKHGSWLNQAEIAINMYGRQCLGKSRIPTIEEIKKKTARWVSYINRKVVTIKWKFTSKDARNVFSYL